jgi:hypothetical protein
MQTIEELPSPLEVSEIAALGVNSKLGRKNLFISTKRPILRQYQNQGRRSVMAWMSDGPRQRSQGSS